MNTTTYLENMVLDKLSEHKGEALVSLDVEHLTNVTDRMVICSGTSKRHVQTLAEYVVLCAKKTQHPPLSVQGLNEGEWVIVDLREVVVHIMLPACREFYRLEALWETLEQHR